MSRRQIWQSDSFTFTVTTKRPMERTRRKAKRALQSDSEEEHASPPASRSRTQSFAASERAPTPEEELDVVNEESPPALSRQNSSRRPAKRKNTDDGGSTKKRLKRVVQSDVEEEEFMDFIDDEQDVQDDEEDDAFVFDEKPTKRSTTKRRGKTDEADDYMNFPSEPPRRKAKATKQDDSFVVADDEEEASQDLNSKQKSPPPPLKRPKLPTIKKNKPSGVSTPIAKAPSVVIPTVQPKQDTVRKPWMEAADLDLSDKSIYEELFKGTGSGAPRAAVRRTKEEERRKELNKLRDEYKAKRAEEAGNCFDLQLQMDRVCRFEEYLKTAHSAALYPNHLAGKWRQIYDADRRRTEHDAQRSNSAEGIEEGEVS